MKKIRKFLKPVSLFMSSLILFVSCEQFETIENNKVQSFDYGVFNSYKSNPNIESILKRTAEIPNGKSSTIEVNRRIVDLVNEEMGTNIVLPDEVLAMSLEMDADEIYDTSLANGWLNESDILVFEEFSNDLQSSNLKTATLNYESKILSLNLIEEEFEKHNLFINIIKTLDYENPTLFNIGLDNQERSLWRCVLAVVALGASLTSIVGCITIIACAVAGELVVNAGYAVADQCSASQ